MTDAQCLPGANDGALATSWDRDDSEPALHIAFGVAPGAHRTLVVAHAILYWSVASTPGLLYVLTLSPWALVSASAVEKHVCYTALLLPYRTSRLKSSPREPDTFSACSDHEEERGRYGEGPSSTSSKTTDVQ